MPIFSASRADGGELLRAGLRREVVVEVVVQLDAVEAGVLGELQALLAGSSARGYGNAQRLIDFLKGYFFRFAGCPWPETALAPNIAADAASNSRRSG